MAGNFVDLLMEHKRRSQVSGAKENPGVVREIAEGASATFGARAAEQARLDLEKKGQEEELEAAKAADKTRKTTAGLSLAGTAIGSLIGSNVGGWTGPYGAVIGGAIGTALGASSWVCSAVRVSAGLPDGNHEALGTFKEYCKNNYPKTTEYYLANAPVAIAQLDEAGEDKKKEVLAWIKDTTIVPVIKLTNEGKKDKAYEVYREMVSEFFGEYAPKLLGGLKAAIEEDANNGE